MDPTDREAILKLKEERPNTVGQVRKLTGFLGYYRKYIQNYARRAKPLYDLLQNSCDKNLSKSTKRRRGGNNNAQLPSGQTVIWTDKHQKAVNEIVDMLLTPQVMAYPNFEKPFILHVDASLDGLGAILYQRQDSGKLAVVAYASRTLTPAEKNYHSGKLEFLALKWAISERFRDYLFYAPNFTVYSDNNPLQYLMSTAKLDATRLRWVSELAGFRFNVKYKPGRTNQDADGLSRMPLKTEEYQNDVSFEEIQTTVNSTLALGKADLHWINVVAAGVEAERGMMPSDQTIVSLHADEIRKAQENDEIIGPVLLAKKEGQRLPKEKLSTFPRIHKRSSENGID